MNTRENSRHTSSYRRMSRFVRWRQLHINESGYLLTLSVIIGLACGAAASLLKWAIALVTHAATAVVGYTNHPWVMVFVPLAGILITVATSRYVVKDNVSNGVARIVDALNNKKYRLSGRTIAGSLLGSTFTLGCGGTAGSEGPIAYTGAGLASKLGQWLHVSPRMLMVMVGCGAGAGIAGIFKAPVGGALFTFEVLRIPLSTVAVLGVFMATLAAAVTAYVLSGYTLDIDVISPGAFDTSSIGWVIVLGIVCGLYSLWYTSSGDLTKSFLVKKRHKWVAWLSSGLAIGLMVWLFPAMYGEGYGYVTDVINGHAADVTASPLRQLVPGLEGKWLIVAVCTGILILKGIGSSATNNGGGVAGDFAPTLFAGAMLGTAFALILELTGSATVDVAHFALIAMAGAMAGIIRAPLMAMFLVTEMIGGFVFLWPVAVASLISYSMVMICKRQTFYHSRHLVTPQSGKGA